MKEIIKHHNGDTQDNFNIYDKSIIDMMKNIKKEYNEYINTKTSKNSN